jgi:hypothetical protein
MDANGQIYFAPEDEIPQEDVERLKEAAALDFEERFERLQQERTVRDPLAVAKLPFP